MRVIELISPYLQRHEETRTNRRPCVVIGGLNCRVTSFCADDENYGRADE